MAGSGAGDTPSSARDAPDSLQNSSPVASVRNSGRSSSARHSRAVSTARAGSGRGRPVAWASAASITGAFPERSDAAADGNFAYLTAAVEIAAGIQGDTETAWRSATGLPGIRPYAVAELNRRAGRNPQRNPLPGLEPGPCDAVTIASDAVLACRKLPPPGGQQPATLGS